MAVYAISFRLPRRRGDDPGYDLRYASFTQWVEEHSPCWAAPSSFYLVGIPSPTARVVDAIANKTMIDPDRDLVVIINLYTREVATVGKVDDGATLDKLKAALKGMA